MINKVIYFFILFLCIGCASNSTVSDSAASLNKVEVTKKSPALKSSDYVSSRYFGTSIKEQCPSSSVSWRKEHTDRILSYAAHCVQQAQWDKVNELGSHLAKKEVASPWGPYFLSLASEKTSQYSRSLWMIELAIKRSPETGFLHYQKGRVYWSMADFHLAVKSFETALKFDPQLSDSHLILGQIHFRDGNFKKSEKHFQLLLEQESENILATVGLAELYLKTGDIPKSVIFFEKAVNLSPTDFSYRVRLASIYETQLKDWAKALAVYKKAKSLTLQTRGLAQEQGIDLDSKIKNLELLLAKEVPGEKVSRSGSDKVRAKK